MHHPPAAVCCSPLRNSLANQRYAALRVTPSGLPRFSLCRRDGASLTQLCLNNCQSSFPGCNRETCFTCMEVSNFAPLATTWFAASGCRQYRVNGDPTHFALVGLRLTSCSSVPWTEQPSEVVGRASARGPFFVMKRSPRWQPPTLQAPNAPPSLIFPTRYANRVMQPRGSSNTNGSSATALFPSSIMEWFPSLSWNLITVRRLLS